VVAIHGLTDSVANRGVHQVGSEIEREPELSSLQAIEIAKNVLLRSSVLGTTDSNATPNESRAATVRHQRAKPIVTCRAATVLETHHAEFEIELVVNADDVLEANLEKLHGGLNGLAAEVHVSHRFEQDELLSTDRNFAELALELLARARRAPSAPELVYHHESNVVAISSVLGPGISQAHDEVRAHEPAGA
jgi:hypothetical protein